MKLTKDRIIENKDLLEESIQILNSMGTKLTDDVKQYYPFVKNSGYKIK